MCLHNCQLSSFHVRIYAGHHLIVIPFCFSLNHSMKSFLLIRTGVHKMGFPGGSVVKNPPTNAEDAGDSGLMPALGRSPGGENGNPFQYFCLENPMDREAWKATYSPRGPNESAMTYQLSMKHVHNTCEFGHFTSNPVPLFREILKKSPCCLKIKAWQLFAWVGFVQRKKNVKNQTSFKQATVLLASDTSWKCSISHPRPAMRRLLNWYATSTLFIRRGFWLLWCSDSDGIWQPQLCCKEFRDPRIDFFPLKSEGQGSFELWSHWH